MDIEQLYKKAISGDVEIGDFETCGQCGSDVTELFNRVALFLESRFEEGAVSYEDADGAMNAIWPIMLDYALKNDRELAEPCYSIYCAFDVGEYDHDDGCDPVEKYTRPAITDALKKYA